MAEKKALWGIPALALVCSLALAACNGIGSPIGAPHIDVYRGSRPPKAGEILHAIGTGEFSGDFIWEYNDKREGGRWYEIRTGSIYYGYYGAVSGENDKEFTIGEGLVNFYLRVKRKPKPADNIQNPWVYSGILGRIQPAAD
jgi:hypothetical protein